MCGIIGYAGAYKLDIKTALASIEHRGPDHCGHKTFKPQNGGYICFGHRRLAILDLESRSNQPFEKIRGKALVYNGEIYNYKTLRNDLEKQGVEFSTNSDTEVLYELLIKHGKEAIKKLSGMFAFAYYDENENTILIARDYLGIKPIYYFKDKDGVYFASEIKAIRELYGENFELAENCLSEFMKFGFLHEPNTGFKNVNKVPPGGILEINLSNITETNLLAYTPVIRENLSSLGEEIRRELNRQMVADVQLGIFFSGGMDSSLLLALRPDLKAMTVKSKSDSTKTAGLVDDFSYARDIAEMLQTDLSIVSLNEDDELFDEVEFLVNMIEEPIADFTGISSYKLSKVAREKGFKVMLSGMGADEIYAGYPRHQFFLYARYFKYLFFIFSPVLKRNSKYNKRYRRMEAYYNETSDYARYTSLFSPFSKDEQTTILRKEFQNNSYEDRLKHIWDDSKHQSRLSKILSLDRIGFLSHNFMVADKSSMLSSIELRVPLATDYRFLKNLRLKPFELIGVRFRKKQLRQVLLNYLPKRFVDRPKRGFHPPIDTKIMAVGAARLKNEIGKGVFCEYFDLEKMHEIVDNHFLSRENNTFKIYRLLFISKWLRKNVA